MPNQQVNYLREMYDLMMFKRVIFGLLIVINFLQHTATTTKFTAKYEIYVWDKREDSSGGGYIISPSELVHDQCSPEGNCFWCHNLHGTRTRVSDGAILNFTQDSTYDQYYLFHEQRQSILEYALVVPNYDAGIHHNYVTNYTIIGVCLSVSACTYACLSKK